MPRALDSRQERSGPEEPFGVQRELLLTRLGAEVVVAPAVGEVTCRTRVDVQTAHGVALLARVFAGHERVLWEGPMWGGTHQRIIGYGAIVQRQRSGDVDWFVVGLAAQKANLQKFGNLAA